MLWKNRIYQFQQIKKEGPNYILCFGLSPDEVHCWIFEKNYAIEHGKPQHKGAKSAEYWLEINPDDIPEWAIDCGGKLEKALNVLRKIC
jgi:hypothetical protein